MKISQTLVLVALLALGMGCGYSKSNTPAQPGTMPTITQVNPDSQNSGGPAFQLEVDGTNFAAGAVINFNGVAQATTLDNANTLKATISAGSILNAGAVPVTVTNPGKAGGPYGGGTLPATSSPTTFTIN